MTKIANALQAERATETEEQTLQRAMRDPEVAVRTPGFSCFVSSFPLTESAHFRRTS